METWLDAGRPERREKGEKRKEERYQDQAQDEEKNPPHKKRRNEEENEKEEGIENEKTRKITDKEKWTTTKRRNDHKLTSITLQDLEVHEPGQTEDLHSQDDDTTPRTAAEREVKNLQSVCLIPPIVKKQSEFLQTTETVATRNILMENLHSASESTPQMVENLRSVCQLPPQAAESLSVNSNSLEMSSKLTMENVQFVTKPSQNQVKVNLHWKTKFKPSW